MNVTYYLSQHHTLFIRTAYIHIFNDILFPIGYCESHLQQAAIHQLLLFIRKQVVSLNDKPATLLYISMHIEHLSKSYNIL